VESPYGTPLHRRGKYATPVVRSKLIELFKPAQDNMKALAQPQFDISKAEYQAAQARHEEGLHQAPEPVLTLAADLCHTP